MLDYSGLKEINSHSSIIDGQVIENIPDLTVYVSSESELSQFADYPAGTIAVQYGFTGMWQMLPDGTWTAIIDPDE